MSSRLVPLIVRIWNTAVFWTWMFNGLRFAAGVLLVPLLWRLLSKPDLGMYGLFFQFTGFLITFDQMFAVTISRFVGYAMRGVSDIQSVGIATVAEPNTGPNVLLLGRLLGVTKRLYRILSLGIFLLLGVGGTLLLMPHFKETTHPNVAWAAWGVTVVSACLELYTGYWLVFMRGLNKVVLSARLSTAIYGFKLALSIALLLSKLELLAVPIATLVTGIVQRVLARHFIRDALPEGVKMDSSADKELMQKIWPNAWRLGLILLSINVMMVGFGLIISGKWGVQEVAPYHFSHQILYSVCISMAAVWTFVKWPIICQQRAENNFTAMQQLIWPRIWLQILSYIALAGFFILLGPPLLKWVSPEKQLLPRPWLILLGVYAFLEMHYTFWTTVISTENRIPSMWAAVITNVVTLTMAAILTRYTSLGLGSFVVAPLVCGLVLNYWFWPRVGASGMGTEWLKFMFRRPRPSIVEKGAPPQSPRGALAT